ncbi:hypothetical protein [Nitrospira moscoviensis]|uniref:Uncharacterized protein n=1 Tax=Nitrospira moscoviensis TaxID=42253 RepID=A0A0K2GJM1_NITMO|nr:hypothetical protein [Nitrospira moscoviensis]ALA61153.1 exported protein of unknown function [Nitrospira moscoviensis]
MKTVQKAVMALAGAAVLVTGALSQPAWAFNFQQTDLILAIYGNRTPGEGAEALINLSDLTPIGQPGPIGDVDALTNPSQTYTFDLSAYLNAPGVKDLNPASPDYPVRYTVMGVKADPGTRGFALKAGSSTNLAGTVQASNGAFLTAMNNWAGNINDSNAPNLVTGQNGAVLGFTNTNSMTSRMGLAEKLNNGFNVTMGANLDQLLHIIKVDSELVDDPAMAMGQAKLFANGLFQITGGQLAVAPIPVPAAVVLFGSGLIGLVGIARRNLFGQTA